MKRKYSALKRITKKQREWLQNYEDVTMLEPLFLEALDDGSMTFREVADYNVTHFEDWASQTMCDITNFPDGEADE